MGILRERENIDSAENDEPVVSKRIPLREGERPEIDASGKEPSVVGRWLTSR